MLLRVRDWQQAKAWYEQKLGLSAAYTSESEKLVIFDLGGTTSLTIWQLKPDEALPPPRATGTFPIFLTDDAAVTHAELQSRGVSVGSIQAGEGVGFFGFYDLDGNHPEVCQVEGQDAVSPADSQ